MSSKILLVDDDADILETFKRLLRKKFKIDTAMGPELFATTLSAGVRQYQPVMAERELLEKTLIKSIKTLVDILSIVNQVAFGRSRRLQRYTRHVVNKLNLRQRFRRSGVSPSLPRR